MIKKIHHYLVGYRSRLDYWSNSKFSNWVRSILGIELPPRVATAHEWRVYKARVSDKFGYWFVEEGLDIVQDIVCYIPDIYRNFRRKFINRFITRSWCLDTKFPRTERHEMDTRILHGLFETLVDFVEHEKAHMQYIAEQAKKMDENTSVAHIAHATKRTKRTLPNREKGLEHLDWEISLGEESPYQSATAKEAKELYLWWKDVRPTRPDPMDESGWSDYCEQTREICGNDFWCMLDHEDDTKEETAARMLIINRSQEIEEKYAQEDTDMLIRLIKIRTGLWT